MSKSFTVPAMRVGYVLASNSSNAPIPETPSHTLRQASATWLPTGEMIPMPVMTTRRLLKVFPLKLAELP